MTEQAVTNIKKKITFFDDVTAFHRKYGIQYDGPPRKLSISEAQFRANRLSEELNELARAIEHGQIAEQLDAYVDMVYIVLGTCHLHGWDFNEAWRRVHAANMAKERATEANPGRYGSKDDIVKPVGWVAPSLTDLV